ncbi:choice-of-anchor E domain-containing protein [Pimelobacter simplex]|uniref:choice-of-anchor E domain-containing protein n=1 Tax=Nocardioides simplex TaxID=2045 RepID=UPI00193239B5|nr:choice-of-anchor E domain-containing protein [Pimelobacter simplex]
MHTMKKLAAATVSTAVVTLGLVVGVGVAPARADQTGTQTTTVDLGDLDAAGNGVFNQFDPALGTLTSVQLTAEVTMDFQVCVTNLSEGATTVNSGTATGKSSISFAGGVVAQADGALSVPAVDLQPNTGTDGCDAWQLAGGDPASQPAGANSRMTAGAQTDQWSATLTQPAQLTPYIGKGTVGFSYTSSSASNLAQPAEWTLVFLAGGSGRLSVTYTYTPGEVAGVCEAGDKSAGCDDGEAAGQVDSAGLPDTGGPAGWLLLVGAGLVLAGSGLVMVRRPHSA